MRKIRNQSHMVVFCKNHKFRLKPPAPANETFAPKKKAATLEYLSLQTIVTNLLFCFQIVVRFIYPINRL